jgi:Tfp pilus assembly protein PilE
VRKVGGLVGVVIVLGIGYYIVKTQLQHLAGGAPPQQVIDVAGVKADLLAIAQAERIYLANHGSFASLDQLQQEGSLSFSGSSHRGYSYAADVDDGQHFKITAAPSDPAKRGWPTLAIDEAMQVTQQ